jgi:cytochrome c-type biogenesis protein CcmH/NrfG
MRRLLGLLLVAALGALVVPELARYRAERRVGYATNAFRVLLDRAADPETAQNVQAVGALALSASGSLPGDPRPWMLVGSSFLVTGQPERALEFYREAFATGERSEIDLNLGRAYGMLRRADSESAAYVRAGWVSPEILASLPEAPRSRTEAEIRKLTIALAEGRLDAPPPLPAEERR